MCYLFMNHWNIQSEERFLDNFHHLINIAERKKKKLGANAMPGVCLCCIGPCKMHADIRISSNAITYLARSVSSDPKRRTDLDSFSFFLFFYWFCGWKKFYVHTYLIMFFSIDFLQTYIFGTPEKPSGYTVSYTEEGKPTRINLFHRNVDKLLQHFEKFVSLHDLKDQPLMRIFFQAYTKVRGIWGIGWVFVLCFETRPFLKKREQNTKVALVLFQGLLVMFAKRGWWLRSTWKDLSRYWHRM